LGLHTLGYNSLNQPSIDYLKNVLYYLTAGQDEIFEKRKQIAVEIN